MSSFIYYRKDIWNAVTDTFLQIQSHKDRLRHSELYRDCVTKLDIEIAYNDFVNTLRAMEKERILNRCEDKDSKKNLKSVFYSLTDYAKKKDDLKILRKDETTQRYRTLYELLICFDQFKKHEMLTEKQLAGFLGKIGCSRNDLKEHKVSKAGIFYEPVKGVQIVKWTEGDSRIGIKAGFYSVSIPGFSSKEFVLSLKKLRKGQNPRPFSSYPTVSDVPFVLYMNYKEQEVIDAINLLRKDGIIQVINGVFPGEIRYDIRDKNLKSFVRDVWLVHDYDFRLLIERLVYDGKPADEDKNYLTFFFGEKYAEKILADAYDVQKSYKKDNNDELKEIANKFIEDSEERRRSLVQDIVKTHRKVINEYSIVSDIAEEICLPHLFHKISQT